MFTNYAPLQHVILAAIPCYSIFLIQSQLPCRRRNQNLQHLCHDISDIVHRLSMNEFSTAVSGVCWYKASLTVRGVASSHFGVANSSSISCTWVRSRGIPQVPKKNGGRRAPPKSGLTTVRCPFLSLNPFFSLSPFFKKGVR